MQRVDPFVGELLGQGQISGQPFRLNQDPALDVGKGGFGILQGSRAQGLSGESIGDPGLGILIRPFPAVVLVETVAGAIRPIADIPHLQGSILKRDPSQGAVVHRRSQSRGIVQALRGDIPLHLDHILLPAIRARHLGAQDVLLTGGIVRPRHKLGIRDGF